MWGFLKWYTRCTKECGNAYRTQRQGPGIPHTKLDKGKRLKISDCVVMQNRPAAFSAERWQSYRICLICQENTPSVGYFSQIKDGRFFATLRLTNSRHIAKIIGL